MGRFKRLFLKENELGQSTVEYILLLVVVSSLFFSVFRSRSFQEFFGQDSGFFNTIAQRIALDYRYSSVIEIGSGIPNSPSPNHPSFAQPDGSQSRFFGHTSTSVYPPRN